jgi:hypothetical protein
MTKTAGDCVSLHRSKLGRSRLELSRFAPSRLPEAQVLLALIRQRGGRVCEKVQFDSSSGASFGRSKKRWSAPLCSLKRSLQRQHRIVMKGERHFQLFERSQLIALPFHVRVLCPAGARDSES